MRLYKRIDLETWWYRLKRDSINNNVNIGSGWEEFDTDELNPDRISLLIDQIFRKVNGVEVTEIQWIIDEIFKEAKLKAEAQAQLLSILDILKTAWYDLEPVHSWKAKWDVLYKEMLLRPWNGLHTWAALQHFNDTCTTYKLFEIMLSKAFEEAKKSGIPISLNAYFADLANKDIILLFTSLLRKYGIETLKNIVIEILELRIWDLDNDAIKNLQILSNLGIPLSVDDFSIKEPTEMLRKPVDKMSLIDFKEHYLGANMSMWVIDTLLAAGIPISFIKVDWAFVHRVLNGQCSPNVILMAKAVLEEAKKRGTIIIWEWFDNESQVDRLSQELVDIDWAQWRNFPIEGFVRKKPEEVKSFRLTKGIPNFKLYNIPPPLAWSPQEVSNDVNRIVQWTTWDNLWDYTSWNKDYKKAA